jgi:hypothetical protein
MFSFFRKSTPPVKTTGDPIVSTTPNPALVAAAPAIDAAFAALSTFITNLGPDPTKLPATLPGAAKIFIGTVELQLPVLVNAEWGVVQSDAQNDIAAVRAKLAAAVAQPATSTSSAMPFPASGAAAAK